MHRSAASQVSPFDRLQSPGCYAILNRRSCGLKHRPQLSLVTPVSAVRTPARFSSQTCQVSKGAAPGSPDWNPPDGDSSGAWGQGGIQASGGIQIGGTLRVRQGPVNAPVWGYTRGPRRGPKMGQFWGSCRGQKYPLFGPSGTPSQGGLPGGPGGGPGGPILGPGAPGGRFLAPRKPPFPVSNANICPDWESY